MNEVNLLEDQNTPVKNKNSMKEYLARKKGRKAGSQDTQLST